MKYKLLSHYSLKAPVKMVKHLQSKRYSSAEFLDWYIKLPDLHKVSASNKSALSKKSLAIVIFCYYFWLFYVISALAVFSFNKLAGLIGIVISPFLVGGLVYSIALTAELLSARQRKKPKA